MYVPRENPSAVLTYAHPRTESRQRLTVTGKDSAALDRAIVAAIENVRASGGQMVSTVLTVNGEEWIYEYNSTGQVERTFRNGEVTP